MTEFLHPIKVRWADCDPADIAFTGRIPAFALEAIDAWWEHFAGIDWFKLNLDRNIGTPFVHMDIDFSSPVTPRAMLLCAVHVTKLGNTSVGFQVIGSQNNTTCFAGNFVCVFVDAKEFSRRTPPKDLLEILQQQLCLSSKQGA